MKKKLLLLAFLAVFLLFGSKAFIALFSYQTIEKLKRESQGDVSITYSWISSAFDGSVIFHDILITPYSLKRTFHIEQVSLHYSSYLDLLTNLPNLQLRDISNLMEINVPSIKAPLKGRDFDEWLALMIHPDFKRPLGVFACGKESRVSHESLKSMGILEMHSSLKIKLNNSIDKESKHVEFILDLFQLGKVDINSRWKYQSLNAALTNGDIGQAILESLTFTHQEQGYFRRLSNYCSDVIGGLKRDEYSEIAAKTWRLDMTSMGILVDDVTEGLYRDYLAQGGQLILKFDLPKPLQISSEIDLLDKDLSNYFGLTAYLNKQELPTMLIKPDRKHFDPPVILPEYNKTAEAEKNQDNKLMYRVTDISKLAYYLAHKASIRMNDGKIFMGSLFSVTESIVQLTQTVQGGKFEYPLQIDDIAEVEVWRNNENSKMIEATVN